MLILTFRILCVDKIGSRAAAACIISTITTTTKISAPGRLQNVDFHLPALLVYGTHNEDRLGKIIFEHQRTQIITFEHQRITGVLQESVRKMQKRFEMAPDCSKGSLLTTNV